MNQFVVQKHCDPCPHAEACFVSRLEDDLNFFDSEKVHIQYYKGETLVKEGTCASSLYYILEGFVKIYLEGPRKNTIIKILGPGDFVGLSNLSGDNHTYNFSASALCPLSVCSIELSHMQKLLEESCCFTKEIVEWYCNNYKLMFTKCCMLGQRQLSGKLACTLLYLNDPRFQEHNIYQYLSRKDLSELSGMALESVVRILGEFNEDGLIEVRGKEIILKDEVKLTRIKRCG